MSCIIERIETAGPEARARRLVFSEGCEPRITSAAAVKALGLEVGTAVDRDVVESALAELEPPLAKDCALMLLGYRERSQAELLRKLTATGYPTAVSRAVVERLSQVQLVDDERFAGSWVRSRIAAGYGRRRIQRELAEKGVDSQTALGALDEAFADGDPVEAARAALRHRVPRDRAERDRMVRKLVSRGFDLSTAMSAVAEVHTPQDGDES